MTKSNKLVILFFIFVSSVYAQNIVKVKEFESYEDVYLYAKKLEENCVFKEAALEYKRYLFLQNYAQGSYQLDACLFLSKYYEENKNFEISIEYIRQAQALCGEKNPDLLNELLVKEILLIEKIPWDNLNKIRLNTLAYQKTMSDAIRKIAFLSIMKSDLNNERWDNFDLIFSDCIECFPALFSAEDYKLVTDALVSVHSFKPKKQMLAAYLSLVPGLGQLYAHDGKDALNAFVLNGSLIGLSTYSLLSLNFLDFGFFEFSPLVSFYRGNLYNAQKDVYQFNEKKINEIINPVIKVLVDLQKKSSQNII